MRSTTLNCEFYVLIQKKSGYLRMKERKLLKQLQRKNEKALEEIMNRYNAYVTTISKEILAGKGTNEDVEEVVSDVFISLWNTAERIDYEKYTSIKAYIGMITRNKAKDKIRAIKHWDLELYDDVVLIDNQSEKIMEQKEQQRIIQKLFQQLKPIDQEIFLLYYYNYLKIEEIALQLNMNPQTIKTRLRRGRETLRNALRREGYKVYEDKD